MKKFSILVFTSKMGCLWHIRKYSFVNQTFWCTKSVSCWEKSKPDPKEEGHRIDNLKSSYEENTELPGYLLGHQVKKERGGFK